MGCRQDCGTIASSLRAWLRPHIATVERTEDAKPEALDRKLRPIESVFPSSLGCKSQAKPKLNRDSIPVSFICDELFFVVDASSDRISSTLAFVALLAMYETEYCLVP